MKERSKHVQGIIRNYYQRQGEISLQRLGELVGDLYLAEGKKRAKAWQYAEAALRKLKIPEARIKHLLDKDDPALLAKLVQELTGEK